MSKNKETVTPSELKTWLSGVLDFQPDDWVPNAEQWAKVLDKIKSLDEGANMMGAVPVADKPNKPVVQSEDLSPTHTMTKPVTRNQRPQAPLANDGTTAKLPDTMRKPVQEQLTVQQTGEVAVVGEGDDKVVSTGKTYKTGMIDTSKGDYQSQFS